jgi:hypothetical protein
MPVVPSCDDEVVTIDSRHDAPDGGSNRSDDEPSPKHNHQKIPNATAKPRYGITRAKKPGHHRRRGEQQEQSSHYASFPDAKSSR